MLPFRLTPQFNIDIKKLRKENRKLTAKVLDLIVDISEQGPLSGIGKPELLKGNLAGCYSRRIDSKHRLIYKYQNKNTVVFISCFGHYSDK